MWVVFLAGLFGEDAAAPVEAAVGAEPTVAAMGQSAWSGWAGFWGRTCRRKACISCRSASSSARVPTHPMVIICRPTAPTASRYHSVL